MILKLLLSLLPSPSCLAKDIEIYSLLERLERREFRLEFKEIKWRSQIIFGCFYLKTLSNKSIELRRDAIKLKFEFILGIDEGHNLLKGNKRINSVKWNYFLKMFLSKHSK